jgi:hypothetical protein
VIETFSDDVYGGYMFRQSPEWQEILGIRTFYEQMWIEEGKRIHYARIRLNPNKNQL